MALRYTFDLPEQADLIEASVSNVLAGGLRTCDIMQAGMAEVSTDTMGESLLRDNKRIAALVGK